jgi:tetratricopeptide (TPR) repeat protein
VDARVSLAEAYRQRQQYDAAAKELEEVLRIAPGRRDVRVNLVRMYTTNFRPPATGEAERLVEQAKQGEPRNVTWPRMLANLYAQRGAYDRAVRELEAAFAVDQKNAQEIKDYRPSNDLVNDYLDVLERGRMFTQLAQQTDRMLEDKDAAATAWWVYLKRAVARAGTGRKADAMADFQRALEIAFNDQKLPAEVQQSIVEKLNATLDPTTVTPRLTELSKQPGADGTRWQVVLAAVTLNADRAEAIAVMDEARAKLGQLDERGRVAALGMAGNIYMAGYAAEPKPETAEKAREVYEALLAARPNDLNALNNLANIFAELRSPPDLPKALEYGNRAYELMTRTNTEPAMAANLLDTIGWVHVLAGGANLDRGVEMLNSSIRASEMPEAQYHLGVALLRKNTPVPAKRSLLRAGEILQGRADAGQEVDKTLKGKVDQALAEAEKALFAPRAGTP